MGVWLDSLPPNYDVQQVIDQLYVNFALQFQDSQEMQRAQQQLDNHKMTGSNVILQDTQLGVRRRYTCSCKASLNKSKRKFCILQSQLPIMILSKEQLMLLGVYS